MSWIRQCELDAGQEELPPIPTRISSNEEFIPPPQSAEQRQVELRLWAIADLQKCARSPRLHTNLRARLGFCLWWRLAPSARLRFIIFALPPLPKRPAKSIHHRKHTR